MTLCKLAESHTGVGLGSTASGATSVTEDMMLAAAKAVAVKLTEEELSQDSILPANNRLRQVAFSAIHSMHPFALLLFYTGFACDSVAMM